MVKVSVIIPTKNEEEFIEKTLKRVNNQSIPRKDYEIIISDSESTDKTVKIAKKFADKILIKKTSNPAKGRNYGAEHAKGDILVFLDADTILPKNALEIIAEKIENGYVAGTFLVTLNKITLVDWLFLSFINTSELILNFFGIKLGNGNCLFIKRIVYKKINGFNTKMDVGEDHDFIKKAANHGRIIVLKEKVITSDRRIRKEGWLKLFYLWGKGLVIKNNKDKDYWQN